MACDSIGGYRPSVPLTPAPPTAITSLTPRPPVARSQNWSMGYRPVISASSAPGHRSRMRARSRAADSKSIRAAFTVPSTVWLRRTRFRMIASPATSMRCLRPGTPVKTNTPLAPSCSSASKASWEAPAAS